MNLSQIVITYALAGTIQGLFTLRLLRASERTGETKITEILSRVPGSSGDTAFVILFFLIGVPLTLWVAGRELLGIKSEAEKEAERKK